MDTTSYTLDRFQRAASALMASLIILTFLGVNIQGQWWQMSDWLIATILPTVIVDLTNEERASEVNIDRLNRNMTLDVAAQQKAEHMARHQYFAHYAPDGTTPWSFFDAAGYVYAHAGENLAIHFTDSAAVVDAWMRSPTHRANIVNADFTEIGVGTARGVYQGFETIYVVQLFGTPAARSITESVAVSVLVDPVINTSPLISNETTTDTQNQDSSLAVVAVASEITSRSVPLQTHDELIQLADNEIATTTAKISMLHATNSSSTVRFAQVDVDAVAAELVEPTLIKDADFTLRDHSAVTASFMRISSGLTPIPIAYANETSSAGTTVASIATRPQLVLHWLYSSLSVGVVGLLIASIVHQSRRRRLVPMAYGCIMLIIMAGLGYAHFMLTSGVVIS